MAEPALNHLTKRGCVPFFAGRTAGGPPGPSPTQAHPELTKQTGNFLNRRRGPNQGGRRASVKSDSKAFDPADQPPSVRPVSTSPPRNLLAMLLGLMRSQRRPTVALFDAAVFVFPTRAPSAVHRRRLRDRPPGSVPRFELLPSPPRQTPSHTKPPRKILPRIFLRPGPPIDGQAGPTPP